MKNVLVLGAGMVGSVIAHDLVRSGGFAVTIADASEAALQRARTLAGDALRAVRADLSSPETIRDLASQADIVAGALPSRLGFRALRAVIEAGRPYADISFMPEDALDLDEFARSRGVTAIVDIGVAPGMSNLLAGYGVSLLDQAEEVEIYVGGLPTVRRRPFEYKAAFSPADVIEEYTRPSRLVEAGREVIREALSEPEPIDLPGVGTLEAFNTDGLRSLVRTLDVPQMKEKTLRYPGHAALMGAFRHTGLFGQAPIEVPTVRPDGSPGEPALVRPLDLTSRLLFPLWTYTDDEEDLTVMRVAVTGVRAGVRRRLTWDLLDRRDPETGHTSMSRTTAFPCAAAVRMLAEGVLSGPGVICPETVGQNEPTVRRILTELSHCGIIFQSSDVQFDGD